MIESPSGFPALVQDDYSLGLIAALAAVSAPIMTLFLLRVWTVAGIDRRCALAEALGATRMQARLRVALPMLWRRARPLVALAFLGNLGAFELPLMLGRQSPEMVSVVIQRRFTHFDPAQRPQAFALAIVYWLLVAVGLAVWLRWQRSDRRSDRRADGRSEP
jgi:putative spermidine/putrescine transport system permease protein